MAERYDVEVEVISQKGHCAVGHKVGDKWIFGRSGTPAGLCTSAYNALFPNVRTLMFGGSFPWETDPDFSDVCCTDPKNPVVFALRRIRK